jgi:putative endonuclease
MDLAQFIAGLFSRSPRSSPASSAEEVPHLALGRRGEQLAAKYLRRHGFKILYRNFRHPHGGEIDLVCREKKILVFVEVKTRAAGGPGRPADAVDAEKEEALMRGAHAWLRMLGFPDIPVRIDIVEVVIGDGPPGITHTRDALAFVGQG